MARISKEMVAEMTQDSAAIVARDAAEAAGEEVPDEPAVAPEKVAQAAAEETSTGTETATEIETDADPAPAPAPEPPKEKGYAERLAALKEAQVKTSRERMAISQEREQLRQTREGMVREIETFKTSAAQQVQALREQALADVQPLMKAREMLSSGDATDHLAALKLLGFEYDETTKMILNDGKTTPEQTAAKMQRDLESRMKAFEESFEKRLSTREQQLQQAAQAQQNASAREAVAARAIQGITQADHPFIVGMIKIDEFTAADVGKGIVDIIDQDWNERVQSLRKQGYDDQQIRAQVKPLDIAAATGILEAGLKANAESLKRAQEALAVADGIKPPGESNAGNAEPPKPKPASQGQPTLSNSEASTIASRKPGTTKSIADNRREVYGPKLPGFARSSG